jgi:SAM-dependent methyltransferase
MSSISSGGADWEQRYQSAGDDFLFGVEPNEYLASKKELFQTGQTAICLADGEGRNSVWLAGLGLKVTAVEFSVTALQKARRLAAARQVCVDFQHGDMLDLQWPDSSEHNRYDWVIAVFIQFADTEQRKKQFADMLNLCKPGGHILLLGYNPQQLMYGTGGPSSLDHLYTPELLREAFSSCKLKELQEYEKVLQEGMRHSGMSSMIGMVAQKYLMPGSSIQ